MISKIKTIFSAWVNVIRPKPNIEKIAADRLAICSDCPNKINQLGLDVCGLCHCPLVSKVRSTDSCPLAKW